MDNSKVPWSNPAARIPDSRLARPVVRRSENDMPPLTDVLLDPAKKEAVVTDAQSLLDSEVADRGGLSGLAIKAGYSAVKNFKPGFTKHVIADLLPEFAKAMDPIYQEAVSAGRPVSAYFGANSSRIADALLGITDSKARNSKNQIVKGAYDKLRGIAKKNVEQSVPRLGQLVEKFTK